MCLGLIRKERFVEEAKINDAKTYFKLREK
jgi:hypothetical protein